MNITKRDWTVKVNPKGYGYDVVEGKHRIADQLTEANAHLIVSAVNACREVNPNNPQAAAEAIKPMYEALKEITTNTWSALAREQGRKALAKAESKE